MKFVESSLKEKKIYKTTGNHKVNYTFVPAICSKLYIQYADLFKEVATTALELNKEAKENQEKLVSDEEYRDDWNQRGQELRDKSEEVNRLGLQIMSIVITNNLQEFEVTEDTVEDLIYMKFSIEDMREFIQYCCSITTDDEKKR